MARRRGGLFSRKNIILLFGGVCMGAAGIGFYFVYLASLDVGTVRKANTAAAVDTGPEMEAAAKARVLAGTVLLKVKQGKTETLGTGFICSPGMILTNIEVLGDVADVPSYMGTVKAVIYCGVAGKETIVPARLHVIDVYARLAFLKVEGAIPAPLDLGSTQFLSEGAQLFIPTFTASSNPAENPSLDITPTKVSHIELRKSGTPMLVVDANVEPMHGGSVVVNEKGMVMGLTPTFSKTTATCWVVPLEDLRFSLNGYVADLALKTSNRNDTKYSFDIIATVVDPLGRAKTLNFYYWTANEGGTFKSTKSQIPLTRVGTSAIWKGSVADLALKPKMELWSQTGFNAIEGGEMLAQELNRASEIGVPGALQPVLAEVPRPLPQAAPSAYRPPVARTVYTPPPPPPPPDSPGWNLGYKTDETSGQKSGVYEQSSNTDYNKSVRPVITGRR